MSNKKRIAHNYNKRYIHGRYVTKATKAFYDGLLITSLVLLTGLSFHLILTSSSVDAAPLVGANPYYIEVEQEDKPQEVAGKGAPIMVGEVTAYSCGGLETPEQIAMNCPNGITATGTVPEPYVTVACDREYLGNVYMLDVYGGIEVVCSDTGGSIKGEGRFDLYVEHYDEAIEFGRQEVYYRRVR